MEPDFSGWITKYGLKCTDGRTIAPGAFAHQDGAKLPLMYQHNHDDVTQVLGHVMVTKKPEGMWGDAYFNSNPKAQDAKAAVQHKDLDKLSIWAKDLEERPDFSNQTVMVHDGVMQEVSLVLAGANAGAIIHNVLAHSVNGVELDPEEDLLVVSGEIMHADAAEAPAEETEPEGEQTVGEVLATLTDEQQAAVNAVIDDIVTEAVTEALAEEPELTHDNLDSSQKGTAEMARNLFDKTKTADRPELKHDDMKAVLNAAITSKAPSLRDLVRSDAGKELMHADTYGIQNIEILFPDAQALLNTPTFIDRRQDWVKSFMAGTSHSPFSRVKTAYADITADEARAKGYIKAHEKTEEVFPVFKRTTGPALIYKKQKLDRMDIIDITDFDVVAWVKAEMRGKLDEEIARAAMFGDGRVVGDEDKIPEPTGTSGDGIRSIVNDDDLYSTTYSVPMDPANPDYNVLLDSVVQAGEFYMGSGNKTSFVSYRTAAKLLTLRVPLTGQRMYRNLSEVAGDMDVNSIVRVPTELFPENVLAVVLDLRDYNFGTNRGGEITLFDDFDIDFNQYKYLMETYLSGALTLPYAAQVFMQVDGETETLVSEIDQPTVAANVVTIPTQTGVVYKRTDTGATVAGGSTITLSDPALKTVTIEATPATNYYFESNADLKDSFTFRYKA